MDKKIEYPFKDKDKPNDKDKDELPKEDEGRDNKEDDEDITVDKIVKALKKLVNNPEPEIADIDSLEDMNDMILEKYDRETIIKTLMVLSSALYNSLGRQRGGKRSYRKRRTYNT